MAEGLLYYFETVGMQQMDDPEKTTVGSDLVEPETPNTPPMVLGQILVNETANWTAVREGEEMGLS